MTVIYCPKGELVLRPELGSGSLHHYVYMVQAVHRLGFSVKELKMSFWSSFLFVRLKCFLRTYDTQEDAGYLPEQTP